MPDDRGPVERSCTVGKVVRDVLKEVVQRKVRRRWVGAGEELQSVQELAGGSTEAVLQRRGSRLNGPGLGRPRLAAMTSSLVHRLVHAHLNRQLPQVHRESATEHRRQEAAPDRRINNIAQPKLLLLAPTPPSCRPR